MDVVDLLQNDDWKKDNSGFRVFPKGTVVWTDLHMDGDRKRIRISRQTTRSFGAGKIYVRYVKVQTKVELIPKPSPDPRWTA